MNRRIITIPEIYWDTCKSLVNRENESVGFMVYGKVDTGIVDVLNVYYMTYSESDNPTNVEINPQKRALLDEFLQGQTDYGYIDFHTHTNETIRRHGDYYNRGMSEADADMISEGLSRDENYVHGCFLLYPE